MAASAAMAWTAENAICERNPDVLCRKFFRAWSNPRICGVTILLHSLPTDTFSLGADFTIECPQQITWLNWLDNNNYEVTMAFDEVNQRRMALYKVPPGSEDQWTGPVIASTSHRMPPIVYGFAKEKIGGLAIMTVFLSIPEEYNSLWELRGMDVLTETFRFDSVVGTAVRIFYSLHSNFHSAGRCVVSIDCHLVKLHVHGGLVIFGDLSEACQATPRLVFEDVRNLAKAFLCIITCNRPQQTDDVFQPWQQLVHVLTEAVVHDQTAIDMASRLGDLVQLDTFTQEATLDVTQQISIGVAPPVIPLSGELALPHVYRFSEEEHFENVGQPVVPAAAVGAEESSNPKLPANGQAQETNTETPEPRLEDRVEGTSLRTVPQHAGGPSPLGQHADTSGYGTGGGSRSPEPEDGVGTHVPPSGDRPTTQAEGERGDLSYIAQCGTGSDPEGH